MTLPLAYNRLTFYPNREVRRERERETHTHTHTHTAVQTDGQTETSLNERFYRF